MSPQGCTRDTFDGRPPGQSTSVLTLLWSDPGKRDGKLDNTTVAPDAPMRVEVARTPGVVATVYTKQTGGTRLDAGVCRTLRLETWEEVARYPEGRATLAGTLAMDCTAGGSHVIADLRFSGCEY